ncbi:MAG: hypothetical protein EYC70_00545 [Planctomycetota bacterium]|nr:MAG: hypothetical protein EYC70_00545 [Planctomycetota bacterium]
MSPKVRVGRIVTEVDTIEDAEALIRRLHSGPPIRERKPWQRQLDDRRLLAFLRAIAAASGTGLISKDAAIAAGIPKPRGLGGATQYLERRLIALGLKPETVYFHRRTRNGPYYWHAGPAIQLAIATLEAEMKREVPAAGSEAAA